MDINLNSIVFNGLISREDILKYVTQEEVYSYYLGESVVHLGVFNSPLREDNVPSFALYFHKINQDVLMFKDYATNDCGDFVVLAMKLFGLSYKEALWKIAYDLGISQFDVSATKQQIEYTRLIRKEKVRLGIKVRPWLIKDKQYWSSFGISKSTLKKFNVYPISHVFFNDTAVAVTSLAYCYVEQKDGEVSYKIYQPLEVKQKKWINNANYSVHQGYTQLPNKGNLLIITKSLKDVMSLHDCLEVPSIGLQSESVMMKQSVMDEYQQRFSKVICLFDNDDAGVKLSNEFTARYNVPHIFVPKLPKVTDFSDLVKVVGKEEAIKTTKKLINEIRNKETN
jgi:5S rRNA maturation endonuclease (ribonuclease M5)